MPIVQSLLEYGKVKRPYLGVYTMDLDAIFGPAAAGGKRTRARMVLAMRESGRIQAGMIQAAIRIAGSSNNDGSADAGGDDDAGSPGRLEAAG